MQRTLHIDITEELHEKTGGLVRTVLSRSGFSRHEVSRLKFRGEIRCGGRSLRVSDRLEAGDILTLVFPETDTSGDMLSDVPVNILYEDEDTAVLFKPAGIPVHASHGHLDDSLGSALASYYRKKGEMLAVRTIGRLDTPVSGAVLYAKNQPAAARLSAQRQTGVLRKRYLAIVQGHFEETGGTIRNTLAKEGQSRRRTSGENGKEAVTDWKLLGNFSISGEDCSLVLLSIRTGRTHQIRSHMAECGHPLFGDTLYGGSTGHIGRTALHCVFLRYVSPFSGQEVNVLSEMPEDMRLLLEKAGLTEEKIKKAEAAGKE